VNNQEIADLKSPVDHQHERLEQPDDASSASASEVSGLARHGDPSPTKKTTDPTPSAPSGSGVEWVRPSELMASRSARVAGRGIDFQAELTRRARRVPGQAERTARAGTRAVGQRARRLPPLSSFGNNGSGRFSWVSRSGIGLG
jgi:hypothetical protein